MVLAIGIRVHCVADHTRMAHQYGVTGEQVIETSLLSSTWVARLLRCMARAIGVGGDAFRCDP